MTNRLVTPHAPSRILSSLIFSLPAFALTTRYGMGAIEAAVLLGALFLAKPLWLQRGELFGPARWIVAAFVLYLAGTVVSSLWSGFQWRSIDNPARIFIATAAIGLIVYAKPNGRWFWYGIFVGAIGAAGIALYQRFVLNIERAGGFHQIIMFGDIAMAMALMALASTRQFAKSQLAPLPYIAFLAGVVASVLSGTRGGWIALPLLFFVFYFFGKHASGRKLVLASLLVIGLSITAYVLPQSGVNQRFDALSNDIHQYQLGNPNSSLGLRLETWKGAWKVFAEHPLLGVGRSNFNQSLTELISRNEVHPDVHVMYHAHNEILHALATEGIVGGGALVLLFGAPLLFFLRHIHTGYACRSYAMAGLLLVLSFIGFGMTQVLFSHHIGAAFYGMTVSVLAGLCMTTRRAEP